jgi:predicted TIM-barrel fold metal-dependent hydrolase
MTISTLTKISADAHVDEPHDLWFDRLPEHLRERAPRRIEADDAGGWALVVDGSPIGWNDATADDAREQDAAREAAASVDARRAMFAEDGIHGEIVFPTIGLYAWTIADPKVGTASCDIYNRWIMERLGGDSAIRLAAMIPTWEVEAAISAVEATADRGFAAHLLPLVGTPEWNDRSWEALWAAIASTGLPVVMHQGTGHDMIFYRGWGSATANLLATQSMAPRATALLSCSGLLERYPSLHVVFVECNAGWMAWAMSTLDEYYLAHSGWAKPQLAELPSHYIRGQIHSTFQNDPVGVANIDRTGAECLLWGNDFPHPESTFPDSARVLAELFDGVALDDVRKIVGGTAADLFGFDPSIVAAPSTAGVQR